MTRGVLYYNVGRKCLRRLAVSMSSLRDFWLGPVSLVYESDDGVPEWIQALCGDLNIEIIEAPPQHANPLSIKPTLWRVSPYDVTMFLDSDTYVNGVIDPFMDAIEAHQFAVHSFCDWRTDGSKMRKRIRAWRKATSRRRVRQALDYGKAVNTGIFGWVKGAEILEPWEALTKRGTELNCTRRLVDELACQMLLPHYPHTMLDESWGRSANYGRVPIDQSKIIHYHGYKHVGKWDACELWKQRYWELRNGTTCGKAMEKPQGDRRLRRYIKAAKRDDLTIVTAVNPDYLEKLRKNWAVWSKTPGLREQEYIVFVNRIKPKDKRLDFIRQRNVRIIPWKWPVAVDNVRERMLSAFVFGVVKHVKTPYWLKLDADATLKADVFPWDKIEYTKSTLTGHKWGYTRVKGHPGAPRHWLNMLDDWWVSTVGPIENGEPFPPLKLKERHGHPRIASYCCVEETAHTRDVAALSGDRLPVPSQDTVSWYVALRRGKTIKRINMKKWITA